MFIYKSRFLTRAEVWFDEEPSHASVDWIYHRQRSSPIAHGRSKVGYTVLNDLEKSPALLLAGMDEKTARKISDAQEKDRLRWERCDAQNPKTLDDVERMWNIFANAQKTPLFERDWVDKMAQTGSLDVSAAIEPAGSVLAYHLVYLHPKRARQLFAISPYRAVPEVAWRNAVSRANCFIHWKNFLAYQSQGILCFDFGGWYSGTTNIQFLGMNRFKQSFGGRVVKEYDCEQPVTAKGWLGLTVARILERARSLKQGRNASGNKLPKRSAVLSSERGLGAASTSAAK